MARIAILIDDDAARARLADALAQSGQSPMPMGPEWSAPRVQTKRLDADAPDVVVLGIVPAADDAARAERLMACRALADGARTRYVPVLVVTDSTLDARATGEVLDAGARDVVAVGDPIRLFVTRVDNMAGTSYLRRTYREHHDALVARTAELTSLFDTVTTGMALADACGRLVRLNGAGVLLLGAHAPRWSGRSDEAVHLGLFGGIDEEHRARIDPLFRAAVGGEALRRHAVVVSGRDTAADRRVVVFDAQPLTSPDGERIGGLVVFRDETAAADLQSALRRDADALAQRNEEMEAFVYTASHDMKSPLRTIRRFANIVIEDYGDVLDRDACMYLERIDINAVRLFDLVDGLVRVVQVGKMELRLEDCDVVLVVEDARQHLEAAIREAAAVIDVSAALPVMRGDFERLVDVFENLISNAIKYRRPDIPCRIEVRELDDDQAHWHLFVRDNGVGIPEGQRERVFGLFHRLHSRDEIEGSGLGLAIVARIVHRHGGRVWAESAPNHGSEFHVVFPRDWVHDRSE